MRINDVIEILSVCMLGVAGIALVAIASSERLTESIATLLVALAAVAGVV